jgi:hypothetical protein
LQARGQRPALDDEDVRVRGHRDAARSELVECRKQERIALGGGLVREPLEHHRRAVRRRREPRTVVGYAALGASAEFEAQFAQPCAVHVAGGCSNTTVTFSNPSPDRAKLCRE